MSRSLVSLTLLLPAFLSAQTAPDTTHSIRDSAVKVFIDCTDYSPGCDLNFFRSEITFINYTQNPQDAEVHVLVTTQPTGGGGTEYTVTLIGQHRFAGRADTLRYDAAPAEAADDSRHGVKRALELGLVGYAASTPLASRLHVSYDAPKGVAAQVHDPWNYWVFNSSVNVNLQGQESFHSGFLFVSLSATRITDRWKFSASINDNYNESDFKLPVYDTLSGLQTGTQTTSAVQRGYGMNALIVKSAGAHWGVGGRMAGAYSSYSNQRLYARAAPAIEYDFFPYSQSTRQLLTLHYELGAARWNYIAPTIFGKTSETLFDEVLTLSAVVKEPWGSVNASVEGAHYLHDFGKHHLTFFGGANLNLYRGLALSFSGSVSLQHDQLSIPAEDVTAQDVLLQQHQLASSFQYFTFVGLQFNFGSIFNNVVNQRFGGSNGGITISF